MDIQQNIELLEKALSEKFTLHFFAVRCESWIEPGNLKEDRVWLRVRFKAIEGGINHYCQWEFPPVDLERAGVNYVAEVCVKKAIAYIAGLDNKKGYDS